MRKYHCSIFAGLLPVFVLGFISHMVPFIYVPSIPKISEYFDLGQSDTTTMMSSYYLSMSLSLLLAGIVGDRLDKKYLLHGASVMIFIGAFLVPFRPSFNLILDGWSFQGFGAGIITVVSQTWIGQSSDRHNITSRFSYMSIVLSLAPLVAPIIGGLITDSMSWKYNFYIMMMLIFCSAMFMFIASPPEPMRVNKISIHKVLSDYIRLLSKTIFLPIILTSLVCFLFQGAFMAYSSFLFINQLGLTPATYGFISVPVVIGSIIGSFIVIYVRKKYNIKIAFILNTIIAATALTASLLFYLITGTHTIIELALVMMIFCIGFGGHSILAIRNVMIVFTSHRSQSSALVNFLNQLAGYFAVLSIQFLFLFVASAMTLHNITCAVTVVLLIGSTSLCLNTIKTHEILL